MERRTGPVTDVFKPPLGPKPKYIPLEEAISRALNRDSLSSPRASQSSQSKVPKPEWKPVAVFTSPSLFQQQLDSTQDVLQSQIKNKSKNNSGQTFATPHVQNFSGYHGQSYKTVKNQMALTNGSDFLEKYETRKTNAAYVSSPTGLHPKSAELRQVGFYNPPRRHSADDRNDSLSAAPIQKTFPISVQNKPESSHVEHVQTSHITSTQSGGFVKPKYKALTVNDKTLARIYKEERTVIPRKQAVIERSRSRSRPENQNDKVQMPVQYPQWNNILLEQKPGLDLPYNTTSEGTPGKKHITLKPKVKSLNQADINSSDGPRKLSFKKLKELEFSVKKLFSKGGSDMGRDEQSVDEGWQVTRSQNRNNVQIPQYRTHHVHVQYDDFTVERSVDGDEHVSISPGIQTQQNPSICQGNVFTQEGVNGVKQDCKERNFDDSDDAHSEREFESSSDEEDEEEVSSPSKWKNRYSKKTKESHIVKEIVSSEKVFVDVLKLLHINFRDAVMKASLQAGKPVIEEKHLNQILFSLPQLYELNRGLLRELEERKARWNEHTGIADIFLKKGPYLKMYSSYICEFDKNVALLEELCRKNPTFAKVVQEFESSPCCANLALKHYMLKPIQRLPQYQLLLTEYFENLDEDSPDYKNAQDALVIVKEVANHANETMKHGDNFHKLMQVQCSLIGYHEVVKPGRVLLKEGTLLKLSRKVMQPRMFFLFNDSLLYATTLQPGQYKLNNELSLSGMKVSKPNQEAYQNELNIESVERSFILSASSPASRDEWLEAISSAIEDYTKKMTTFHPSSKSPDEVDRDSWDCETQLGTKAPIWIPDLRATMCMICTCEFTLTWRRHHCRACGRVVCQACSVNRHPLEYLKNRPARVCDQCFETLQHNSSEINQAPGGLLSPTSKSFHFRKTKKIPAALKEVSANTDGSSMSGYLYRMKANKRQWKRFWFVIKDKVLYTYAASEVLWIALKIDKVDKKHSRKKIPVEKDVAALESLPLLGFSLTEDDPESALQFQLYHKNKIFYIFRTTDHHTHNRWVKVFREAVVL